MKRAITENATLPGIDCPAAIPSTGLRADGDQPIGTRQWYLVLVMALVCLVNTFDRTIAVVMIEPIKHEFGLSDKMMGAIVGFAFAVSYSVMLLPIGLLVDRVNRRNLLALIIFLWSAATAFGGFARGTGSLLLSRMVVGAAEAGAAPTALSLISDTIPANRRATAIGFYYAGSGIGGALTGIVGGAVIHTYGWRSGFFVAAIPGTFLALLILLTLWEPQRGAVDPPELARTANVQLSVRAVLGLSFRDITLICCYIGSGMMMLAMTALASWFVPLVIRERGLPVSQAGMLLALVLAGGISLGGALGGPIGDSLAKRHSKWRLIYGAIVAAACIPLGAIALTSASLPLTVGLILIMQFLSMSFQGPVLATMLNRLPPMARGGGTAIVQIVINLIGYGFGSFAVGWLSDVVGGPHSLGYGLLIVETISCSIAAVAVVVGAIRY